MNFHRAAPLFLAFLNGAAGLARERIWTRRLVDSLDATAEAFAKVMGCFFIGLSLGAWRASRLTTARNKWRRVASAERSVAPRVQGRFENIHAPCACVWRRKILSALHT